MDRLEDIQARYEAVTPGPCRVKFHNEDYGQGYGETTFYIEQGDELLKIGIADSSEKHKKYAATAAFIAASYDDIPWLRGEVERIGKENAKLKDELEHCADGAMVLAAESAKLDEKVARLTAELKEEKTRSYCAECNYDKWKEDCLSARSERDAAVLMSRAAKGLLTGADDRAALAVATLESIYSTGVPMQYVDYSRLFELIAAIVPEGGPADDD